MKTYWHIVPAGDGYKYLGLENGKYIVCSKEDNYFNTSLLFKTEKECLQYIKDNLNLKKYSAEKVMLNEKYYNLN
jgi:hypothetical protein